MEGYAKVGHLMAKYEEFAILRRFKALNYRNLLYLQAEIIHLEDNLARLTGLDADHKDRAVYSQDWWALAHGQGRAGRAQWRLILRIRNKLDNYNDCLARQISLARLNEPNAKDLAFFRDWFERPSNGAFPIRGLDLTAWDDADDLIAVKPRLQDDPVSRWFMNAVFPLYHRLIGQKIKDPESPELGPGIFTYKESRLVTAINIFTTVVAALLPMLSTAVLFHLQSSSLKLWVTVVLSAVFALALALMTNARNIEIFVATAGFAAVNGVFMANSSCIPCR